MSHYENTGNIRCRGQGQCIYVGNDGHGWINFDTGDHWEFAAMTATPIGQGVEEGVPYSDWHVTGQQL
ncbi:MAG: hypothetical protein M3Q97_05720 [Bacteroidota bacterium]|nr:hypothetical protein [Bacteroidota bacterium]